MELAVDRRIGGIVRNYMSDGTPLMRVPEEVRKCVVYVGYMNGPTFVPGGTALLVAMTELNTPLDYRYLITARHCIDWIKANRPDQTVTLRFNSFRRQIQDEGVKTIDVHCDKWLFHSDPSIDVAAIELPLPVKELDHRWFLKMAFIHNDAMLKEERLGVGDEIFVTGLFKQHSGKNRNIPIVRVGNLAAMREDKIELKYKTHSETVDAYLIEARSIGGLSGSPVFIAKQTVSLPMTSRGYSLLVTAEPSFYLLGIVRGHWDIKDDDNERMNMGIAFVTPAEHILQIMDHPTLMASRHEKFAEWRESQSPTLDMSED